MLWEFVLACILIELMPGPNMGYLAALALDRGRGAGMMAVAGVALGLTLAAIAAGLGLAAVVAASPVIWEALRWAGVAYLLWLGWDMWREADRDVMEDADGEQARYFRRGLLANLLSPKTYLFFIAALPRFAGTMQPDFEVFALLAAIYVAVATAIHSSIVIAAGSAHTLLSTRGTRAAISRALALVVAAMAIWLAVTTGRS